MENSNEIKNNEKPKNELAFAGAMAFATILGIILAFIFPPIWNFVMKPNVVDITQKIELVDAGEGSEVAENDDQTSGYDYSYYGDMEYIATAIAGVKKSIDTIPEVKAKRYIKYKLVTTFRGQSITDYGSFKTINKLKCERKGYAQKIIDSLDVLQTECK